MTYEEAMKILHPNTTLTALAEVEYYGGFNGQEAKIKAVEEACLLACEALEKQIAKKPEFVDTRFMHNGKHIHDGVQLQKCYRCPNCNDHIFHVWDDEKHCVYCGQAIDWEDDE